MGKKDIISGSLPGHVYLFRRESDGKFAGPRRLAHKDGKDVNVGVGSSVFAYDWDGDGKVDLIVGTAMGEVFFLPNVGTRKEPVFGEPRRLSAGGKPIEIKGGEAAPVVADWDGDGKPGLVVGGGDGSVVWFRNEGAAKAPKLARARLLVPPSPSAWRNDKARRPGEWGVRVKPCVVDWNGDGKLDLLIGDRCGGSERKPSQTPSEAAEEKDAVDQLAGLRKEWAAAYKEYSALTDAPEPADVAARGANRLAISRQRDKLLKLKDELDRIQDISNRYKSDYMAHGYVWLFLRQPVKK